MREWIRDALKDGFRLTRAHKDAEAAALLEEILRTTSDLTGHERLYLENNYAWVLVSLGRPGEARPLAERVLAYARGLRLEPYVHGTLARALVASGRYAEGLEAIERAIDFAVERPEARAAQELIRGDALDHLGRFVEARAAYHLAVEFDPRGRWGGEARGRIERGPYR